MAIGLADDERAIRMKNRLKEFRINKGWSQARLAELLSVSRQNIIAIEKEKYDPSLMLALKIARLFETNVETIFQG